MKDHLEAADITIIDWLEKCSCAYCEEGMSKSAEQCVDRMVEVSKSLEESLEDVSWKQVFRKMYPWYRGRNE